MPDALGTFGDTEEKHEDLTVPGTPDIGIRARRVERVKWFGCGVGWRELRARSTSPVTGARASTAH